MQENYEILGISSDATDEEIERAYLKLKDKYSEERFLEGEKGNIAAKKLSQIQVAYKEIMNERNSFKESSDGAKINYKEIEDFIRKGEISEAQRLLDNVYNRDGEWHYLQSVVFYKKNWYNESKKQLEIAINLDPNNTKYSDAYTKLKVKMEYNENQFHSGNANYGQAGNNTNNARQMGGTNTNECCSFCATWCCMDMLCSICCR